MVIDMAGAIMLQDWSGAQKYLQFKYDMCKQSSFHVQLIQILKYSFPKILENLMNSRRIFLQTSNIIRFQINY